MSRGFGKVQVLILDILKLWKEGEWVSSAELVKLTDKHQQAVYRALKGLVDAGLVQKRWSKTEGSFGRLPQRYAEYTFSVQQEK